MPVPLPCRITIELFKNSFFILTVSSPWSQRCEHTHRQRLEEKLDFVFICINFYEMKKKLFSLLLHCARARATIEKGTGSQRTANAMNRQMVNWIDANPAAVSCNWIEFALILLFRKEVSLVRQPPLIVSSENASRSSSPFSYLLLFIVIRMWFHCYQLFMTKYM